MNFRLITLASCVALGSISLAGKADAQTVSSAASTVAPTLSASTVCVVGAGSAMVLDRTPGRNAIQAVSGLTGFGTVGTASTFAVNCPSGGLVYVNPPVAVAAVSGFNPAVTQAVAMSGTNFTTASQGGNFDGGNWARPSAPLVIAPSATPGNVIVGMIAGTNVAGSAPSSTAYDYTVSITAVPN